MCTGTELEKFGESCTNENGRRWTWERDALWTIVSIGARTLNACAFRVNAIGKDNIYGDLSKLRRPPTMIWAKRLMLFTPAKGGSEKRSIVPVSVVKSIQSIAFKRLQTWRTRVVRRFVCSLSQHFCPTPSKLHKLHAVGLIIYDFKCVVFPCGSFVISWYIMFVFFVGFLPDIFSGGTL